MFIFKLSIAIWIGACLVTGIAAQLFGNGSFDLDSLLKKIQELGRAEVGVQQNPVPLPSFLKDFGLSFLGNATSESPFTQMMETMKNVIKKYVDKKDEATTA